MFGDFVYIPSTMHGVERQSKQKKSTNKGLLKNLFQNVKAVIKCLINSYPPPHLFNRRKTWLILITKTTPAPPAVVFMKILE